MSEQGKKYRRIEVCVTEKQYRYLKVLGLLKNKNGLSATVRWIIEEYRKDNRI